MRYVRLVTALAILCGVFEGIGPAPAEDYGTKDAAVAVVTLANARGNDGSFDVATVEFMDRNSKCFDRDIPVVVVDMAGTRMVHGQNPKLGGKTGV